jgi:signal transduction histidine kinase
MIYGVFLVFCDLSFEDVLNEIAARTPDIKYNLAAQFYICHIILFIIVIFIVYFGEADNTLQGSEDFENFKNLMKKEGLE